MYLLSSDSAFLPSSPAFSVLKRIYGTDKITTSYSNTISSVAFAGTVVGMLAFGYLSDKLGRKFGMVCTASIAPIINGASPAHDADACHRHRRPLLGSFGSIQWSAPQCEWLARDAKRVSVSVSNFFELTGIHQVFASQLPSRYRHRCGISLRFSGGVGTVRRAWHQQELAASLVRPCHQYERISHMRAAYSS